MGSVYQRRWLVARRITDGPRNAQQLSRASSRYQTTNAATGNYDQTGHVDVGRTVGHINITKDGSKSQSRQRHAERYIEWCDSRKITKKIASKKIKAHTSVNDWGIFLNRNLFGCCHIWRSCVLCSWLRLPRGQRLYVFNNHVKRWYNQQNNPCREEYAKP